VIRGARRNASRKNRNKGGPKHTFTDYRGRFETSISG
jgi:hypothetical protein